MRARDPGHAAWVASLRIGDRVELVRYRPRGVPHEPIDTFTVCRVLYDRVYLMGLSSSARRRNSRDVIAGTMRGSKYAGCYIRKPAAQDQVELDAPTYRTSVRVRIELNTHRSFRLLDLSLEAFLQQALSGAPYELRRATFQISSRDRRKKP